MNIPNLSDIIDVDTATPEQMRAYILKYQGTLPRLPHCTCVGCETCNFSGEMPQELADKHLVYLDGLAGSCERIGPNREYRDGGQVYIR